MLPLFCVTTGISHRVQRAILVNFPNAVLNATRSILKKDKRRSDPWDFLLYEFYKMPSARIERGNFFQCLIIFFCIFYAFLHWGLFC